MRRLLERLSGHLDKKIQVLCDIKNFHEDQRLFLQQNHSPEEIDASLEPMEMLADQLTQLDVEFKQIYPELAGKIEQIKVECASELKGIQVKNQKVNILETQIAEMERENKARIDLILKKERMTIKQGRQGSKAAYGYYRNMSGAGLDQSHTWDSKH